VEGRMEVWRVWIHSNHYLLPTTDHQKIRAPSTPHPPHPPYLLFLSFLKERKKE